MLCHLRAVSIHGRAAAAGRLQAVVGGNSPTARVAGDQITSPLAALERVGSPSAPSSGPAVGTVCGMRHLRWLPSRRFDYARSCRSASCNMASTREQAKVVRDYLATECAAETTPTFVMAHFPERLTKWLRTRP